MDLKNEKYGWSILTLQIFVGIGTLLSQFYLQQKSDDREYVQMAIMILSEPKNLNDSTELREWATEVLNKKSPVPFGRNLFEELGNGNLLFPTSTTELNYEALRQFIEISNERKFNIITE